MPRIELFFENSSNSELTISPSNRNELSQQVPLMREIYQQAQTVLIWLRDHPIWTAEAIPVLAQLAQLLDALPAVSLDTSFRTFERPSDFPTPMEWLAGIVDHPAWPGVGDILTSRNYFLRLWVVQEKKFYWHQIPRFSVASINSRGTYYIKRHVS